ncbi:MAG: sulfotransferase, partial [Alphaproteobacteria bacterium]|nr:sulfotransferase [Alphaproteobacteria bacterium]
RLDQLDAADASYRRAIDLRPDYAEAHRNLAMTLRRQGRPEDAAAHFRQAIAHGADDGETHYSLGNLLREMAQLEAAADCYRQAIARRPDHAESHNQLGMTLQEFGQFDEAVACYETALQLNPGFGAAHHNLGALRTFVAGDARIDHMQELVDDPATAEADAAPLLFALGKAYGDLGQHGRSFDCFLRGNRLKRGTVEYDGAELADTVARLRATFDGELFERFAGAGCPSDLPIFVVGMPRSGTTLVEQIIASHPAVHGAGELPYLIWLGRKLPTWLAAGRAIPEDERAIWRDLGEEYLAALRAHAPSMAHITDKLPNNFLRIGLIQMILPNATIVHCQRSPMDTCLSCFTLLFSEGQPFSYDLAELGHFYRQYEALMSHWRTVLPGRFLDLRYEDLLSDLEGQARRLIDHCGLAWDDRCLNFHQTERTVRTASLAQVRQPIYTSSRGRWRRYEHHLGPLIDALGPSADVA